MLRPSVTPVYLRYPATAGSHTQEGRFAARRGEVLKTLVRRDGPHSGVPDKWI
jgi:hypothetical protein